MRLICSTFVLLLLLFGSCASVPYNPGKPEMSVPENSSYKTPRSYNLYRNNTEF